MTDPALPSTWRRLCGDAFPEADAFPSLMPSQGDDAPLVSAVIPTYNGAAWIGDAIGSVLEQTYPAVEVIVVDDHSTDETPRILESYADRCRILRTPERAGHAAVGRNIGWRAARGEWIALLDHDDVWHPRKLELQAAAARNRPETRVWHTGGLTLLRENAPGLKRFDAARPLLEGRVTPDKLGEGCFWPSSVMLRRDLLEEYGGFEERYWALDDVWLLFEIARRGEIIGAVKVPLVYLRVHPRQTSRRRLEFLPEAYRLLTDFAEAAPAFAEPAGRLKEITARGMGRELAMRSDWRGALIWYGLGGDPSTWPLYDRAARIVMRLPLPGLWPCIAAVGPPLLKPLRGMRRWLERK
jgi:glycosyltransferase involved in cell wall biosynthesis